MEFIGLRNADATVSIGDRIVDKNIVTCNVNSDDVFVAIHPAKFFVTFRSTAANASIFYIQAKYSTKPIGKSFVNERQCSDKGQSV